MSKTVPQKNTIVTTTPTIVTIPVSDNQKKQFEQTFLTQTEARKKYGLPSGQYLIATMDNDEHVALVKRITTNDFIILATTTAQSDGYNERSFVLEPKQASGKYLYLAIPYWKHLFTIKVFDAEKNEFLALPPEQKNIERFEPDAIAITEDRLLYIGNNETTPGCTPKNYLDCTDWGRFLNVISIHTAYQTENTAPTKIGELPKGYSYAKKVFPPNLMGDVLLPAGTISWGEGEKITATIYSDKKTLEYNTPDREALETITITPEQTYATL